MTQKELGLSVGFLPVSADVRIAQYESGSRSPKEPMLNALAAALERNRNFAITFRLGPEDRTSYVTVNASRMVDDDR